MLFPNDKDSLDTWKNEPAELNKYANKHGYTTGEWWNSRGGYWEFCLFDWQNRYNHPWRIRPIFVFNFRTGRAEHIESGLRHWLFSKPVINDITNNVCLATLLVVVFIAFFAFGYYLIVMNLNSHLVDEYRFLQH